MNILVVTTVKFSSNGVSNVIKNLYCNKVFSNQDNNIIFLLPNNSDDSLINELKSYNYKVFLSKRRSIKFYRYIKLIYNIIKDEQIDIIHLHGNSHSLILELLAAKIAGCRNRIVHAHSASSKFKILHKLLTPIFNLLYTYALACGDAAGKFMFGNKKYLVIKNGIDTNKFIFNADSRKKIRNNYNIENNIVIGHVGTFSEVKNHSFLLDLLPILLKKNPKYKLLLIGEGSKLEDVKRKAMKMGVSESVIFVGSVEDVSNFLSACDLIVMPSLFEGFPLTLVEEQANGLKCICSDAITKDVDLTGNVIFLSLNDSKIKWVNAIIDISIDTNREDNSISAVKKIREEGYYIMDQVINLYTVFRSLLLKNGEI